MSDLFFEKPVLNSPYAYPVRHWELDDQGQPTQRIIENRRHAEFITPIPKPRKRKGAARQQDLVFDEGKGLSTQEQQYEKTSVVINELRRHLNQWRSLPNPNDWQVTPETARLLQHWRHHPFSGIRPFFCQIEAVETAIWSVSYTHLDVYKRQALRSHRRRHHPGRDRAYRHLTHRAPKPTGRVGNCIVAFEVQCAVLGSIFCCARA